MKSCMECTPALRAKISVFAFLLVLVLGGCSDPATLGLELAPQNNQIGVFYKEIPLNAQVVLLDSFNTTNAGILIVGDEEDTYFGKTRSTAFTRLYIEQGTSRPTATAVLDSVFFNFSTVSVNGTDLDKKKKYAVQNVVDLFWLGKLTSPTQQINDAMGWSGPIFWKFWQPGIAYGDGFSTFNDPLFRSAEVFLMAAEAIVKGATGARLGTADVYYNRVLDRALASNAGKSPNRATNPGNVLDPLTNITSYRATPSTINIDMILDEYGREFLGEGNERWYQLKRTGKLIERATKFNGWTAWGRAGVTQIAAKHLLRPIPQGMLDNSSPRIEQNPGY